MKKKVWKFLSYVLVAAAASVLTLALSTDVVKPTKLQQLENMLQTYFVDGVDTVALEDAAAAAMVDALSDRWSYYIPASQMESYVADKKNAYVGIGVTITTLEEGYEIIKLTEGGPAQEAGLQVGDLMIRADGQSLAGITTTERDALIKGPEGSTVELTVLRQGREVTVTVTRRTVQVPVATGKLLSDGVGLVSIVNFNDNCSSQTIAVIESLRSQGATSILFDVRYNGGGYAHEMIALLDYLLPEGVLFQTEDYKGETSQEMSDEKFLDMPMAVLVNGSTYSAAEFFAAALREYDAAFVAGEQTSGKGYFQNTFQLIDGSAVAISTGKYCTPNGVSLEGVGITPDIPVAVDAQTAEKIYAGTLAPEEDPQIQAAINALKTAKLP